VSHYKFLPLAFWLLFSFVSLEVWAGQSTPEHEPARGSLAWRARQARSEGKSEITLPVIYEYPEDPASLDLAIMDSTVLVAKLIESKAVPDEYDILTWRKYKIVERLSKQSQELPPERDQDWQRDFALAPKSMLPLASDEFLAAEGGGTAMIDGVKITVTGIGTQELPQGGKYLMFVLFGSGRQFAQGCYGETSDFTIDDSDTVHARLPKLDSDKNFLLHEIRQRANGNLAGLRAMAATVTNSH
jgi:hypothetical protein